VSGLTAVGGAPVNILSTVDVTRLWLWPESIYARIQGSVAQMAIRSYGLGGPVSLFQQGTGETFVPTIAVVAQWGAYKVPHFSVNGKPIAAVKLSDGSTVATVYLPIHEVVIPVGQWPPDLTKVEGTLIGPYAVPPDSDPNQFDLEGFQTYQTEADRPRGLSGRLKMRLRRLVG